MSFGTAVITPRWLYVLAAATPAQYGAPVITDETLEPFDPSALRPGDVVGIGIHTANALREYRLGRLVQDRGAVVVFGGIHATLFRDEAREHGAADIVVRGDGDVVWPNVLVDCVRRAEAAVSRRAHRRRLLRVRAVGPAAGRSVYVGIGPDRSRLSEALLVLLGLAYRRATAAEIRRGTQHAWDQFYRLPAISQRSTCVRSRRGPLAFLLISKLYRQMYANTGIATDSARVARSAQRARLLARLARRLFVVAPMPDLQVPPAR